MPRIKEILDSALAVSLRVDGSVDRYQMDNVFVMAKVVEHNGNLRLLCLGFERPASRGVDGMYYFNMLARSSLF